MCDVNAQVALDLYRCALVMHSLYLTSVDGLVVLDLRRWSGCI